MLESGGREIAPITHISQHFFVSGKPSQMSCDTMSPPPAYQDLDLENWDTEATFIFDEILRIYLNDLFRILLQSMRQLWQM